ncbi:MAG: hypothetical protein HGA45_27645 [Chloroflexales bacterium]|nr:hypothetical protein [Chloroflexales bacterium]
MSIGKPRNAGLVDTIGAGYRALHRRLWVIGIPMALSAYLWLGTPVAIAPMASQLRSSLHNLSSLFGGTASEQERIAQGVLSTDVRLAMAWLNFVPVLAPPTLVEASSGGAIGLRGPLELAAAMILINLLALLLSSYFLTALSEAVSGEPRGPLSSLRHSLRVAGDIARYLLTLAVVGFVLALPFLAISAIVIAALPGTALFILLAWYIALFWAYVYTGFAPEAILISKAGPLRAIYNSVHIVRRDLMGTLGLLLLSFVILSGLGVIWRQIAATPPGLALAILSSAYIGSGLSAARLEFYRERLARWAIAGKA